MHRFTTSVRRARTAGAAGLCAVAAASALSVGAQSSTGLGEAYAGPCSSPIGNGSSDIPVLGNLLPNFGPPQGPQAKLPEYDNGRTRTVGWVTGPLSRNRTFTRFGISGTDLGVAWDDGRGRTLLAFGDTFGNCKAPGGRWRHNVLLSSTDQNLADGLSLRGRGFARQMFGALGLSGVEKTAIPTAGIAIGGKQYINYMSVRRWGTPGRWDTNYSAIAVSGDGGRSWSTSPDTVRLNGGVPVRAPAGWPSARPVDSRFQQAAYVKGTGADAGWVFQYGTPNGRFGSAYLSRFRPADILHREKYEYWTSSGWSKSAAGLTPVIAPRVSELSVAWSPYLNKYVMMDSPDGIQMRTAPRPQGPWTKARRLAPNTELGAYAPMMLPNSPALRGTGPELYFNASRWHDYNVLLMRTRLSR